MTRVDVVIVNYRRPELTALAMESVLASEGVEARVILVENAGDGAWVRERWGGDARVRVIANRRNVGFGPACNQGIEAALRTGAELVFLLNNDATVEPYALRRLALVAEDRGLAAPKILLGDGRIYAAGGVVELMRARCRNRGIYEDDRGQYDRSETMVFASACALMLTRRALESGVRFHEPFFLYYEDADLCLQLARRGFGVTYEPRAVVHHLESATTGESRWRLDYYDTRNRWLLLRRHGGGVTRWIGRACLLATVAVKGMLLLAGGQRRRAGALAGGLRDALRGRYGPMPTD